MEKIKGLAIELDMDHLSVDRGLKGLKDNIRTVNAEMRKNMSVFDYADRSVGKYETRLTGLNKKLEVQKVAVEQARKEYEEMVKEHGRGSKEAEKAAREYNNQAASLNNLERYIERTKDELIKLEREQRIANSSFTKLGDKLETASNKIRSAGERMGKVGSTLTNKITKPAVGAAAALASLTIYQGFKRLIGIDTARAQLIALGHSAENVDRIMDAALASVKGTSYGLDEAATTAASAVAAGVDPAKELEKYLSLAADTASVANVPFNEMGDIFNKVQTSGKAQNDVLRQLSKRGIPIYQYLAETIGKGTEEIEKMARDGKIGTKDFLKAVEDNIGGASKVIGEKSFAAAVKNIGSDIGRIGANFLDAGGKGGGFFSKLKPLLVDFRGWLEKAEEKSADLGAKFGESFEKMVDKAKELKRRYDELSPAQQDFVNKVLMIAPAVAIGAGPAITLFSKLTVGVSAVVGAAGKLSTAIGVARGAGLAAGLASLGPLAVGGIAVAGLAAVGVAVYKLTRNTEEFEEVNLDVAESLYDQSVELEKSAETFEKLSDKAKITNAELAELNDLNIRISESSNPGEIEQLQKQYDRLAEKSGLSADELEELFEANADIIKQAPDVETTIGRSGEAWVKNTEKIKEYIAEMRRSTLVEMEREREKLLENELKLKDQILEKEKEIIKQEERYETIYRLAEENAEGELIHKDKIIERNEEIEAQLDDINTSDSKRAELLEEQADLSDILNENGDLILDAMEDLLKSERDSLENTEKDLELTQQKREEFVNLHLSMAGINEEGEKGLANLDKSIAKNDEELEKLDQKLEKNGELTEKEQERYDKLSETNEKQRETRDLIFEEYGLYSDINNLAQHKLDLADDETQKKIESLTKSAEIKAEEGDIIKQLQKKNDEHDKGIEKLEKQKKEEGANKDEINKSISALQDKKAENDDVIKKVLQELGIWEDVKDSIDIGIQKEKEKGTAVDGTKNKLDSQGQAIDNNNRKTDIGIGKEKDRTAEAGRSVDKSVTARDHGSVGRIDTAATKERIKKVTAKDYGSINDLNTRASKPVDKTINFIGRGLSSLKFWEKGTPPSGHPGGPAVIGEKGSELVKLPSGRSFLSPNSHTLLDLPRGSHVIPHQQTKRIVRNAPRYADGTRNWASALGSSELARLLSVYNRSDQSDVVVRGSGRGNNDNTEMLKLLFEQNEYLRKSNELLTALLGKDLDLYKLTGKVDEGLNDLGDRRRAAFGG